MFQTSESRQTMKKPNINNTNLSNPKQLLIDKINNYLNITIGSFTGIFVGNAWATVRSFLKDPEHFLAGGGKWYTGLVISGVTTAVIIAGICVAKKIVSQKLGVDLEEGSKAAAGKKAAMKAASASGDFSENHPESSTTIRRFSARKGRTCAPSITCSGVAVSPERRVTLSSFPPLMASMSFFSYSFFR